MAKSERQRLELLADQTQGDRFVLTKRWNMQDLGLVQSSGFV